MEININGLNKKQKNFTSDENDVTIKMNNTYLKPKNNNSFKSDVTVKKNNSIYTPPKKKNNSYSTQTDNYGNLKTNSGNKISDSYPNLNETQKKNIDSAYHAKTSGIISEQQYKDNLKLNGADDEYKPKKSNSQVYNLPASEPVKRPKIPSEKLEQERLRNLTGEYNLNKVDANKLKNSIRLKEKTPDDYYDINQPYHIAKKRIDEAFGPKTDFSISNFENNYDKMSKEEQGMLTHKMQLEFNRLGYRDKDGFSLRTDGIYGPKTKSVYEKYKKDNQKDYDEAISYKKSNSDAELPEPLKDENGNIIYLASTDDDIGKYISQNPVTVAGNKKTITTPIEEKESVYKLPDNKLGNWLQNANDRNKKITTEALDTTMYTNKKGVNYTMYEIIERLIDAKKQYMTAQKNNNVKLMNIHKEVGKYLKAMIKMSNEFSEVSGDKKFTQLVLDAENYDMYGTDPNESIKKWNDIQKYSVKLAETSQNYVDSANNTRGITIERIYNDIQKIYESFEYSNTPIIYISATSYSINPNDNIDVNNISNKKDEDDYYTKLTYYYTNSEKEKEKYRAKLLPADVNSDIGETQESIARDFIKKADK